MKHNFDIEVNRRHTGSYKWDSDRADDNTLPVWVADMDFRTAPCIIDALQRRVAHGIFGYTKVDDAYYEAVRRWFGTRHGWEIDTESIHYTTGVVPALSVIIKALTAPGDAVAVMTPVYNCFFSSIRNNGCSVAEIPLLREGDTYVIDYERLSEVLSRGDVKMLLLCNPHNPVGRVWRPEELQMVADIAREAGVRIVSDEIHCELVYPGYRYTPMQTIDADCISCISPSKAFNTAGLQIANIVTRDAATRAFIDRAININEVCDVNPFGVTALKAAYTDEGAEWLSQLLAYLHENYTVMREFCASRLPDYPICRLEGTYLVWMDTTASGMSSEQLEDELLKHKGLWLNAGSMYGTAGDGFMRWNIACPRTRLMRALELFESYVNALSGSK